MCDGKLASKRDVVILSIKPKRPDFPSSQKVVPVTEFLQEWDKLDAYYRGQLLKATKSFTKTALAQNENWYSKHQTKSRRSSLSSISNKQTNKKILKKHSDQFTELFGDENLFTPAPDTNNNSSKSRHNYPINNQDDKKSSDKKLLLSKSLNSLFDDDEALLPAPPPSSRRSSSTNVSRKNSLSSVNGNLVVSIPVLTVQKQRDHDLYNSSKRLSKCLSESESSGVSKDDHENDKNTQGNFLSVPRDNFQVQYGTQQKTRVALLENTGKFIVPIRVAPYKPPAAQGLNGVQIQKILYHKNDKVNFASPTTTTARTPDKPPDNHQNSLTSLPKSAKTSSEHNSPVSTVSPRSISSGASTKITVTPASGENINNSNATPKLAASGSPPESDQGYKSCTSSSSSSSSVKLSLSPVNSTTGNSHSPQQKLKRPISLTDNQSSSTSAFSSSSVKLSTSPVNSTTGNSHSPQQKLKRPISLTERHSSSPSSGKKPRLGSSSSNDSGFSDKSPSVNNILPVASSHSAVSSLLTAPSRSSSTSSLPSDTLRENDHSKTRNNQHHHHNSPHRSRHSSNSSSTSSSSATSRFKNAATDNATTETSGKSLTSSLTSSSGPHPPSTTNTKQKLNIINKHPTFVKPPSSISTAKKHSSSSSSASDHSVFIAPAAVSITDRIIKKASRLQPELVERQKRRWLELNRRKTYSEAKRNEHAEIERIDLSIKSFEMIWNGQLLSPLRSP